MATAISTMKLLGDHDFIAYDHDPGATTAIITSPDGGTTKRVMLLTGLSGFGCIVKPTIVGGAGISLVEIIAADDAAMSVNVVQVKSSGAIVHDSLDDHTILECSAEEISTLSQTALYAAVRITMATNTDEASVVYIGISPRFRYSGLSASLQN